jgi:hypothetical protein
MIFIYLILNFKYQFKLVSFFIKIYLYICFLSFFHYIIALTGGAQIISKIK